MTKFYFFLVLFLAQNCLLAQQKGPKENFVPRPLELKAQVVDTFSFQNLEFVDVRLFSGENKMVAGQISDSSGTVVFDKVSPGVYTLRFKFFGYKEKIIGPLTFDGENREIKLGRIALSPILVQNLQEMRVVGRKDVMTTSIDKRVYNVGEDLNNQGSNASEVLNNVPSVEVDQDGNVSLRGDGNVIILIDGRPSTLTGSAQNMLDAIPASAIERIEVVTNPSAKYDPDGTSGIINIVLKKNKLKGFNGLIAGTGATGPLANGSASLSVRNNKVNAYGSYSVNYREGERNFNGTLEQRTGGINPQTLYQNREGTQLSNSQNARLGFDYYITGNQTVGFSGNYRINDNIRTGDLVNVLEDSVEQVIRKWNRVSNDPSESKSFDLNAFYQWNFNNDRGSLNASASSSIGDDSRGGDYQEYYTTEDYIVASTPDLLQRLENTSDEEVQTTQIDYVYNITGWNARFEAGSKAILSDELQGTFSERYNDSSQTWIPDTFATFDYAYSERVYSAYAIYGQQYKRWKYQVGLRAEIAEQIPNLLSINQPIPNQYKNLFPSGHLRYDLKKDRELSFGYSRRINRPRSRQLNPFTNYSDPNNLRRGNPYLKPEYINSYDLSWIKEGEKGSLTASVFYRQTTEVIQRVKEFYSDNTAAVTYSNIDESRSYGTELIWQFRPSPKWRGSLSANGDHMRFINSDTELDYNNSGYNIGVKSSLSYFFWKKTASIAVNGRYNSPRISAQGVVLPRASMDIAAEKTIKDGAWAFGTRVSDVFNTRGFQYDLQQGNTRQLGEYKWLTRRFYLTVTYKFGKIDLSKGKSGSGGDGGGVDF
jgi:outer membrane receptor protein involved in Fe transport